MLTNQVTVRARKRANKKRLSRRSKRFIEQDFVQFCGGPICSSDAGGTTGFPPSIFISRNFLPDVVVPHAGGPGRWLPAEWKEPFMGDITGLAAVVMVFSIPIVGIAVYGYYRVSKLRTEERLAALARGVNVPMEPELSQAARSRRAGILLVSAAIGYVITFALIARVEPDAWVAASFGAIPFTVGLGFFLDSTLVRRDLKAAA
jgi:Domain of unknown function (DUF6249)